MAIGSRRRTETVEGKIVRGTGHTALAEEQNYEIKFEGNTYQVEVQLLENADRYIHVGVAVDDGSIPASFRPLSSSFVCNK
jgi:hypothetical protein